MVKNGMNKYLKYLGIKHEYDDLNCITLIDMIYKEVLCNDIFDKVAKDFIIKPNDRKWMIVTTFKKM